jgi:hypothetical protein
VVWGTYRRGARIILHPALTGQRDRSPPSDRCDQPCDQGSQSMTYATSTSTSNIDVRKSPFGLRRGA